MPDSFITRLVDTFEARPSSVAMRIVGDNSEVYTFGQSLDAIRSIASQLSSNNIEKGDRVALIGENHPCWALAYLGTLYRGAVCVPVDPQAEIETLSNFIENSEAKFAFLSSDLVGKFRQIEERIGRSVPAAVWGLGTSSNGFEPFESWKTPELGIELSDQRPDIDADDIALLIYTSGTTGTPKGVPLTHGNILAELDGIDEVLKFTDKERILSLLPLFHAYLQIVNLWVATTFGCEVGYLKTLTPAELGEAMKEFKPTILTTVPRLWYLFHKKIFDAIEEKPAAARFLVRRMLALNGTMRDTFGVNLGRRLFAPVHDSFGGSLRIAISAGSRFDESCRGRFSPARLYDPPGLRPDRNKRPATATFETDNRVGSVGKPMLGTEIKINEPDNEGVGEVLIRGGVVFDGYYRNEAATAEAFTSDGWFRSGDLGKLDADGHLYIVGRAKDVIVLPSGKNVHPEDLEIHYLRSPLIEELAIIGVADEREARAGAERLAAVVVPDFEYLKLSAISNSKEAIRFEMDNLGRELPEYQRVRDYSIRAEPLPSTATRKIKRFELKKAIENGLIAGAPKEAKTWDVTTSDIEVLSSNIGKAVIAAVKRNAKDVGAIHPDMNLEIDLGLDSLARAETFAALEHAFSTEFEGDEAARALTVRDAVSLIEKHVGAGDAVAAASTDLNWSKIVRTANDNIPELRTVLKERPFFMLFAFTVYKAFNIFCRFFMKLEIAGRENLLSMNRPFIICPNHQSFLDPFVVCSTYTFDFFKNTFHVGAAEFFANPFMSFVARMLHVVPVDPDTQLMKAMKAGAIGLRHNKVLNIYPEGERAFDGELHQFKKGAAILATELDLPILPVAIDGLHKVWARRSMKIRPGKVKVRFGEPIIAKEVISERSTTGVDVTDEARYDLVTTHLKETIRSMINEMRRSKEADLR